MPGVDTDKALQLNQMEEAIKKLIPEKKPVDPEQHIREILGKRTKEAAAKGQSDILIMISRFGNDLIKLRDSGVDAGVFNLPLKNAGWGSNWGLRLLTEINGGEVRQVVSLSEDRGGRQEYTRYAPVNVDQFLGMSRADLTEQAKQQIKDQATMDGSILVKLDENDQPTPAFSNVTNTFVWDVAYKAFYDARDVVDHQSGDKYKKYTEEDQLRTDLSTIADRFSEPLEEFIPSALTHLQQASAKKKE